MIGPPKTEALGFAFNRKDSLLRNTDGLPIYGLPSIFGDFGKSKLPAIILGLGNCNPNIDGLGISYTDGRGLTCRSFMFYSDFIIGNPGDP
jgi:hypothetical protein